MSGQSALPRELPLPGHVAPAPQAARPRRRRPLLIVALLAVLIGSGALWWQLRTPPAAATAVLVYGSIDIRQSQLAFNDSDRISRILVQEGDQVHKGQLLAELDTARLQADLDKANADVASASATIGNLNHQIAEQQLMVTQAQSVVAADEATLAFSEQQRSRYARLAPTGAATVEASQQWQADTREKRANLARDMAAVDVARQHVKVLESSLTVATAALEGQQAALTLAQTRRADARLYAPADGVIEDRILEVGDMASPDRPALTLDLTNPVYARAYLPERELGRLRPGMRASIETDAYPGHRFPAWVGFISTTAEFTPKTVETTEVRTELVYRMHVYACNPDGRLRLGAPVTVVVPLKENPPAARGEWPCG